MERKKEHFFDWDELSIDKVVEEISKDPNQARSIMEFIRDEMNKEEEFKEKLAELHRHHKEKEKEIYEEYGKEYLVDEEM